MECVLVLDKNAHTNLEENMHCNKLNDTVKICCGIHCKQAMETADLFVFPLSQEISKYQKVQGPALFC